MTRLPTATRLSERGEARTALRAEDAMDEVSFTAHPAPAALDGLVRELWHLSDPGEPHRGLPKPYVELVVSLRGIHWWCSAPGLPEHRYVTAWVTPLQSGPRHARAVGRRELVGARLEP